MAQAGNDNPIIALAPQNWTHDAAMDQTNIGQASSQFTAQEIEVNPILCDCFPNFVLSPPGIPTAKWCTFRFTGTKVVTYQQAPMLQ
jgi:hypothetical protein